jgi:hypothetical protein
MELVLQTLSAGFVFAVNEVLYLSSETVQSTSSAPCLSDLTQVVSKSVTSFSSLVKINDESVSSES